MPSGTGEVRGPAGIVPCGAPGHTETEGNVAAGTFEGGGGAVLAGKTPLGRLSRATDIAPLLVFLASDESAWITGEVLRAGGALTGAGPPRPAIPRPTQRPDRCASRRSPPPAAGR